MTLISSHNINTIRNNSKRHQVLSIQHQQIVKDLLFDIEK